MEVQTEVVESNDTLPRKPTRGRPRKQLVTENITTDNTTLVVSSPPSKINGRSIRNGQINRATPPRINMDKPIFTLSVAADILGLHPRTLRIYEEHGLVVPYRTTTQRRRYSQNDIKKFHFIQYLTRERGVNLNGVKIILFMLSEMKKNMEDPTTYIFPEFKDPS
jgi:MerR family transcriptional regulator/heat shock protein HspR